jgi:hypothetical protein
MNKKGLSTIVVTLLIILISLVAVGIVWAVVNNMIKGGTQGVEVSAKCLNVVIEPTKVNCSGGTTNVICDVQLMRTGTGSDIIGGVKLLFKNATSGASSSLIRLEGNIEQLIGKKQTGINTTLLSSEGANTLEITAFFKDSGGNDQNCAQTGSFTNFS